MNQDLFNNATNLIVSQIEGGYYHPNMLADGRVKDGRYNTSGETMFGIDRLQGGTINQTPAGKQFWQLIDNAGAANNWKWNYNGGALAPQLQTLAAQMMLPAYTILAQKTLTPQAQVIVEGNPGLLLHFIYATWNGPGWFKVFADKINTAVASGVTDIKKLMAIAIDSRVNSNNSLIAQGGAKIAGLMNSLMDSTTTAAKGLMAKIKAFVKAHPIETAAIGLTVVGIGISVYFGTRNTNNAIQPTKQLTGTRK